MSKTPAKANEQVEIEDLTLSGGDAEAALMRYLCTRAGKKLRFWDVVEAACCSSGRTNRRLERTFLARHLMRLVRENKVKRYYKRGIDRLKIRINEAYVSLWKSNLPGPLPQ